MVIVGLDYLILIKLTVAEHKHEDRRVTIISMLMHTP